VTTILRAPVGAKVLQCNHEGKLDLPNRLPVQLTKRISFALRETRIWAHKIGAPAAMLDYLVRESGRTVPRAELLSKAWNTARNTESNVVDVHVKKLRKKLRKHAKLIETVRGVGYRIDSGNSILPN